MWVSHLSCDRVSVRSLSRARYIPPLPLRSLLRAQVYERSPKTAQPLYSPRHRAVLPLHSYATLVHSRVCVGSCVRGTPRVRFARAVSIHRFLLDKPDRTWYNTCITKSTNETTKILGEQESAVFYTSLRHRCHRDYHWGFTLVVLSFPPVHSNTTTLILRHFDASYTTD